MYCIAPPPPPAKSEHISVATVDFKIHISFKLLAACDTMHLELCTILMLAINCYVELERSRGDGTVLALLNRTT